MQRFFLFVIVIGFSFQHVSAQRVIEIGIKPTEFIYRNFEANAALGNKKARYGIFLSYRPSTQNSGEVDIPGTGSAGGYGNPNFNKLYNSYTVGLYQKTYLNKELTFFVEADVFYRNWSFKNKQASFKEERGYWFNGTRTEDVDVYGLKLLIGQTIFLSSKKNKRRFYLDVYGGLGVRHRKETYETFDGYVNDVFYTYKKDQFSNTPIGIQGGVKLGLLITR